MKQKRLRVSSWAIILLVSLITIGCTGGCTGERTAEQGSRLHFKKGLNHMRQNDISKAIAKFKYAIRLDPEFDQPYYYLGVAYMDIGGGENALEYLNKYLEFEPEHFDTHQRLLRIFLASGRTKQAIVKGDYILSRLAGQPEEQARTHAMLGDVYLKIEDLDAATFHFKKVLKHNPGSVGIYMKMVKISLLNEDQKKAQELLARVIMLDPSNIKAYHQLADIYIKAEKEDELAELYKKILELKPEDVLVKINLANIYFKRQMYEQAKEIAYEILELDPSEPAAHFILGRIYLLWEQYPQALEGFTRARKARYELNDTLSFLGIVYQKLMQWDEAIGAYENLVSMRPEEFEALLNLTKLFLRTKRWDKAARRANEIVYRFYGFEEAYLLQGLANMHNGDWESARDELQNFFSPEKKLDEAGKKIYLKIYPNLLVPQRFKKVNPWYNILGHYLLGICYLAESNLNLALTEFNRSINIGSAFYDPYLAKAVVYHLQGRPEQAINACLEAMKFAEGDQGLVHLLLANIYTSQGDLVAAQEHMLQAEGAVPGFSFKNMDITKNLSQKNPTSLAQLNLGMIYLLYGWKDEAKDKCRAVLDANPQNPLANYIIDEVHRLQIEYFDRQNRLDDSLDKLLEYP